MLNCLEATRLLSERQERPLMLRERLALLFHLSMCRLCRAFGRSVKQLHTLLSRDEEVRPEETPGLADESRVRLEQAVNEELK